jgi:serine/threonine protein kinase
VKSCKSNDSSNIKYIKKELKILKMLTHPNIIRPYGIFESASNVKSYESGPFGA